MWDAKAYNKAADTRSWWSMMDLFERMAEGMTYGNNSDTDSIGDEEVLEELDYSDVFVSSAQIRSVGVVTVVTTSLFATIVMS